MRSREKDTAKKPKSTGTGRFIICYGATVHDHQVYIEIKQGPSGKYFVYCPLCGLKAFLNGQLWWDAGMPLDEVRKSRHYLQIVAAAPPAPPRQPRPPGKEAAPLEAPHLNASAMPTPKRRAV